MKQRQGTTPPLDPRDPEDAALARLLDETAPGAAGMELQARLMADFELEADGLRAKAGRASGAARLVAMLNDLAWRPLARGGALAALGAAGFLAGAASAGGPASAVAADPDAQAVAFFETALDAAVGAATIDGTEEIWGVQ